MHADHMQMWVSSKAAELVADEDEAPTPANLWAAQGRVRQATHVHFATLATAAAIFGGTGEDEARFDCILVDEAAASLETTVMPVLALDAGSVVLVGDERQLPPIVLSQNSQVEGFGRSLFERLVHAGAPVTQLSVQRRCHPSIADTVRWSVYGGTLQDVDGLLEQRRWTLHFLWSFGPVFVVTVPHSQQQQVDDSIQNPTDANAVLTVLRNLDRAVRVLDPQRFITVKVLAAYAAQVQLLRQLLSPSTLSEIRPE